MSDSLETEVDHVRGGPDGRLILEYGDYECPYSRRAFRAIERVERSLGGRVRFAFRHFPLIDKHPHALAAAAAAEAAAFQGRFCARYPDTVHRRRRAPRCLRRRRPACGANTLSGIAH
jgi:protein-disulfide isomerase